jgi:hypothetical protein
MNELITFAEIDFSAEKITMILAILEAIPVILFEKVMPGEALTEQIVVKVQIIVIFF